MNPSLTGLKYIFGVAVNGLEGWVGSRFGGFLARRRIFWDRGGEGGLEVVIVGSFGGGAEGREEKRLRPDSDDAVMIAMKE
jgi:hypothetical protein